MAFAKAPIAEYWGEIPPEAPYKYGKAEFLL
jgi:hypothetical protein